MPTKKHANAATDTRETKPKRKYIRKQPAGGLGLYATALRPTDDITFTINGPFARQFMHGLITAAFGDKSVGQHVAGVLDAHLGQENV